MSYPADVRCPSPLPSSGLFNHVCDLCLSLIQMFVFLSRYVVVNIILSIFVCAAASLFFAWVVSAHVSAPYVSAGSTHKLYTFLVKHGPVLRLKMSWCLANAVHPAVIRKVRSMLVMLQSYVKCVKCMNGVIIGMNKINSE